MRTSEKHSPNQKIVRGLGAAVDYSGKEIRPFDEILEEKFQEYPVEEPGLLGGCVERNTTPEENEAQEELDEEPDHFRGCNDRTVESNRISQKFNNLKTDESIAKGGIPVSTKM